MSLPENIRTSKANLWIENWFRLINADYCKQGLKHYMKTAIKLLNISLIFLWLPSANLFSQVTPEDYQRADSIIKLNDLVFHGFMTPSWIDSSHWFWYKVKTRKGQEYFLVDAGKQKKMNAFDQERLCSRLNDLSGRKYNPDSLPLSNITFINKLKEMKFEVDSIIWKCNLDNYKLELLGKVEKREKERYWGESIDELGNSPVASPDSQWLAYIKNFNVHIRDRKTNNEFQLSYDGSEGEFYSSYFEWSPDSRYIAVNKIRDHLRRFVYFVESSPKDQLQPELHKIEYLKPGDALLIKQPSLFSVEDKKQIPVNTGEFNYQYDISMIKWWKDNRGFTFEFNQRGHQAYQVIETDALTGAVRIVIDERSKTFIDYSSKRYRFDVNDGQEIIWASERAGWNHLYLFDGKTGSIKNKIT